jgi:enoyl-CoA hydratase/carnithine racemase
VRLRSGRAHTRARIVSAPVTVELREGGVLAVTLSRPEVRNALDGETFRILGDAFGNRAHAGNVRAVVLSGQGQHFCSGLDRSLLAALATPGATDQPQNGQSEGHAWQKALLAVENCPRPTLVVVQGACIGGGVELALACDFRLAAEDASFSLMEMRYAFLPDLGGIHRVQREVGLARAKEFVYFGDRVDAQTLGQWGVLNEVVSVDGLAAATERWAQRCAAAAPLAVAAAKRLMQRDPTGSDVQASLDEAITENITHLLRTEDFREGLASAMERRPPRFTGA